MLIGTGTSSCRCCPRSQEGCLTHSLRLRGYLECNRFHTERQEVEGGKENVEEEKEEKDMGEKCRCKLSVVESESFRMR